MVIGQWQLDDNDGAITIGGLCCDGDGQPGAYRKLAHAVPPIKGKNQLMWTIWGGRDKR